MTYRYTIKYKNANIIVYECLNYYMIYIYTGLDDVIIIVAVVALCVCTDTDPVLVV
jgi:hypothetical protein